jgi:hypothetical protein
VARKERQDKSIDIFKCIDVYWGLFYLLPPLFMSSQCKELCNGLSCEMNNHGEKLVISISGEKRKLAKLEKKLTALHELCADGECPCV